MIGAADGGAARGEISPGTRRLLTPYISLHNMWL